MNILKHQHHIKKFSGRKKSFAGKNFLGGGTHVDTKWCFHRLKHVGQAVMARARWEYEGGDEQNSNDIKIQNGGWRHLPTTYIYIAWDWTDHLEARRTDGGPDQANRNVLRTMLSYNISLLYTQRGGGEGGEHKQQTPISFEGRRKRDNNKVEISLLTFSS